MSAEAQMIISERPTPVFAWVVVVDSPDRRAIGTVYTLHPDTTTIGRVPGNRIILRDEAVSAQHARIRCEIEEGQEPVFALFDMGSRKGILVGDRETYRHQENRIYRHELQDGDYLLLGETTLVFKKV
jgi:pSer/pThr/pTyr-binding forkhead associated (FHA) protein